MNDRQASGGIGFAGALTLLFIGLKLGGVITWSWLWVLAPLWIPFTLFAFIVSMLGGWYLWAAWLDDRDREARRRASGAARPREHGPAKKWGRRG